MMGLLARNDLCRSIALKTTHHLLRWAGAVKEDGAARGIAIHKMPPKNEARCNP
jgi:hypothetical protein